VARGGGFGLGLPDVGDVLPLLLLGGGAYFLLAPGQNGTSLVQRLGAGIAGANVGSLPGASGAANASAQDGPANGGPASFNFNLLESNASYSENNGRLRAHAGFGHVGGGGTFAVGLDVHNTGALGFLGLGSPWLAAGQQWVSYPNEGEWTGHSVDFDLPLERSLFTGLEVRFWISGSDGSLYQRTNAIGASIGF